MSRTDTSNRRIVLASRPVGAPTAADFRAEDVAMPEPKDGEVLVRTLYLSLDPYMRGRMSDVPSYAPPVEIGAPMVGGTVGRVVSTRHSGFQEGDLVSGFGGWQSYAALAGDMLRKLPADLAHPSHALGILGMPGFTAYTGLLDIGRPRRGETVVVAAASGAVGALVGQIARIEGCRTIGIAGGAEKCRYLTETLGLDAGLDHRAPDFADQLARACPDGIDVYFESVGGAVFEAVLPLLNVHARIPVCGLIAQYNADGEAEGPDRLPGLMGAILRKRLMVQGFIIGDHYGEGRYEIFFERMSGWLANGRVQAREDVVDGLDAAPAAFAGLLEGKNFGKLLVKVSD